MRQAMKIMKEQAAAMAVQAQQQAQEAAMQKSAAEASLASANADLAEERTKFTSLQVNQGKLLQVCQADGNVIRARSERLCMLSCSALGFELQAEPHTMILHAG